MTPAHRLIALIALTGLIPLAGCASVPAPAPLAVAEPEPQFEAPKPDPDASVLGLYLAANAAASDGRQDMAAAYFAQAADKLDPQDGVPLKQQAFDAALLGGRIPLAASLAPENTTPTTRPGGNTAFQQGQLVVAIDDLGSGRAQAAYDLLSGDKIGGSFRTTVALLRPWAAAAAGQVEASVQSPNFAADPITQAFARLDNALLLEKAGRLPEAEAAFKAVIALDIKIDLFRLTYAEFLERRGRRPEALKIYEGLLADRPDNVFAAYGRDRVRARKPAPAVLTATEGAAQSLLTLGRIALAQNRQRDTLVNLRLSLFLNPRDSQALMQLGDFQEDELGDEEEARRAYGAVPAGSLPYLAARRRLALSYINDGEADQAVQVARQAVQTLPRDLGAQELLSDALRASKDYAGAVAVLDKVIAGSGKAPPWRLYYYRAVNLERMGQWPLAEKDIKTALSLAPDQPELQNYLGYAWADRNENLDEALVLLKKAHQAEPESGAILDSLGWVYYRMGDNAQAVANLEAAVEAEPAEADINDHLGDAYLKAGRRLEARYQWERVLTLDADPELVASAKAKLAANPDDAATAVAARMDAPTP